MNSRKAFFPGICLIFLLTTPTAQASDAAYVDSLVMQKNIDVAAVRQEGPDVLPILARLYTETHDQLKRAKIAWLFYQLDWKSEEAKEAMLPDINTTDTDLRLQVQWALGRVSNDNRIVDELLDNMQNDKNPVFRDKAACALASDQVHLTDEQRFHLLEGLIRALHDPKPDVRRIAIQALQIQTGQDRGYNPDGSTQERLSRIAGWEAWLAEYRSNM